MDCDDMHLRASGIDDGWSVSSSVRFHSNPDMLADICEYLSCDDDFDSMDSEGAVASRKCLAALARTCKAYQEPALDRLWRSLDTLYPLFRILPAFTQTSGTHVLRGKISAADWDRFDWYGRRVKRFCYTRDPVHLDIAMHVYFRIAQLRSTPLLPCLRYLYCPDISQNDFLISGVCLFLTPSLQALEFCKITGIEDKLSGTFLHTLFLDGAELENITFKGLGLTCGTLDLILPFERLRSLELEGMGAVIDLRWLKELGSAKFKLEDLALDFTGSPVVEMIQDEVGEVGFRHLKSLMLTAPLSFTRTFIPKVTAPALETIVAASHTDTSHERVNFMSEVVGRWSASLRSFALVHVALSGSDDSPPEGLDLLHLSRLFPQRDLQELRLEGYVMELSDSNVEIMALAWPNLTKLLLPYVGAERSRPTIKALEFLKKWCKKLRHLRIPLDIAQIPPFVHAKMVAAQLQGDEWKPSVLPRILNASTASSDTSAASPTPQIDESLHAVPSSPSPSSTSFSDLSLESSSTPLQQLLPPDSPPAASPSTLHPPSTHAPHPSSSSTPSSSRTPSPPAPPVTSPHPSPSPSPRPHRYTPPHPLTQLTIATSDDHDTPEERLADSRNLIHLARYLDFWFRGLRVVSGFSGAVIEVGGLNPGSVGAGGEEQRDERWVRLGDLVAAFRDVREEAAAL